MEQEQMTFEFEPKKVIKGYPELHWMGKRPYRNTQYYPAQLKETYGNADENGWINKIFWGDNLQVMSHLLKEYRGQIDLIYIDPPFDSKADYKKKIKLKNQEIFNDNNTFEEKQYGDIWTNDEYLQFMYERLLLLRELLSDTGTIYLHCDWHKSHHLRMLMDEVFGPDKFVNEIIWTYEDIGSKAVNYFKRKHDSIFMYSNSSTRTFNVLRKKLSESTIKRFQQYFNEKGQITYQSLKDSNPGVFAKLKGRPDDLNSVWLDMNQGQQLNDWWTDISALKNGFSEALAYPTQKPEALLERIIKASTDEGDLVFDCFMGSGTTQSVALKMNRRFIGADINLGAVQTTTKRLLDIIKAENLTEKYTGFEVYNVNNYDLFRNPVEAKDLIIEALEIQKFDSSVIYDGEKDGRMVYIMPVNRIATRADLEPLKANLPYKSWEKRKEENANAVIEKITLVCMGHESDLKATLEQDLANYKLDIEIIDLLRDKSQFTFKRDAEAKIKFKDGKLTIENFYPMNLLQKLSYQKEDVDDWKQLVESVIIDYNYDGESLKPQIIDVPDKKDFVQGVYEIPASATRIKIKITDLLSESLEVEVK